MELKESQIKINKHYEKIHINWPNWPNDSNIRGSAL